ncbi:PTS sugar transporter subunit IIA [Romboutsia ilealis]|uniref:PTS sugar transporter subunit IIA n=1 Tax=Romboutsia faecis TaxID=2764597 RepID=A0ABR7JPV8_9FIRM|nr:PTS sugar transporter subunit IIA [Romboutsia faecis]MBC5996949.1 PTS sugar transporter subunit IIA [Romboutsia faecis]MRN25311.1 PTS sugar transporter subunit IIA [Romboutsia ilealis]
MNGIIIIGHGNFGSGLNSTLEIIAGKYDFVKYGDFTSEKSPEEFKAEVRLELEKLRDKDKIFFFTDVVGGTPFKVACELKLEDDRIEVFYGTNMAMIIETCMNSQFDIELDNDSIAKIGKSNIDSFKLTKKNQAQEMAEEGI